MGIPHKVVMALLGRPFQTLANSLMSMLNSCSLILTMKNGVSEWLKSQAFGECASAQAECVVNEQTDC